MPTPLIRTKLHRPPVDTVHLHREHLLDRLNKRLHRPLTLVSAPAGYGKSTLVSCWLETSDLPAAWLSIDETDNDIHIFWQLFKRFSLKSAKKPRPFLKFRNCRPHQFWPAA